MLGIERKGYERTERGYGGAAHGQHTCDRTRLQLISREAAFGRSRTLGAKLNGGARILHSTTRFNRSTVIHIDRLLHY